MLPHCAALSHLVKFHFNWKSVFHLCLVTSRTSFLMQTVCHFFIFSNKDKIFEICLKGNKKSLVFNLIEKRPAFSSTLPSRCAGFAGWTASDLLKSALYSQPPAEKYLWMIPCRFHIIIYEPDIPSGCVEHKSGAMGAPSRPRCREGGRVRPSLPLFLWHTLLPMCHIKGLLLCLTFIFSVDTLHSSYSLAATLSHWRMPGAETPSPTYLTCLEFCTFSGPFTHYRDWQSVAILCRPRAPSSSPNPTQCSLVEVWREVWNNRGFSAA